MLRIPIAERPGWREKANDYGFIFHTMHGQAYWDETAYYQFSLKQIEQDLEKPTEEIHQMCLHAVDHVLQNEQLLKRFCIPQEQWSYIADSWQRQEPSLYSRLDFAYNGQGVAKLYENNADTPTSVFETGFWQWLWLSDNVDNGTLLRSSDQFNSLQEKLVNRFKELRVLCPDKVLHFACCRDTDEDRGTVQYLEDCAIEAGITTAFVYIEDIGVDADGQYADANNIMIEWLFKLYPWEFMMEEEYNTFLAKSNTLFLEPPWKSILSNKAILPVLWQLFPDHPNLLPAFFEDQLGQASTIKTWVKKPIFSREGANISIIENGKKVIAASDGPYGDEGFIYQAAHMLPSFGKNNTLIGSWLVDNQAAGISIREDDSVITQDMSRYVPHVIVD